MKSVIEGTATSVDDLNPGLAGKLGRGRIDPLRALQSLNSESGSRQPYDIHSQVELGRGPTAQEAYGKATVNVAGSIQEFIFEAYRLNARTRYKLVVDGILIALNVSASSLGSLKIYFTNGINGVLPAPLNPVTNIRRVELRDMRDQLALGGELDSTGATPSRRTIEREARLISTGAITQAGGFVSIKVESSGGVVKRESLILSAENLTSRSHWSGMLHNFVLMR